MHKSLPPDKRPRAASAGVRAVGVARELAQPREDEREGKAIPPVNFPPTVGRSFAAREFETPAIN